MRIFTKLFIIGLFCHAFAGFADSVSNRVTITARGDGPDVVLIPGLACSSAVWDATAKHLEGHYRLHIVQVAGFGGAPAQGNAKGAVVQPTVDAIDAYIKTNNLKSPTVIGHSLGGLMGMMLALQHPEDTGKLMIVDSFPFIGVLFGAADVTAVTDQASQIRDMMLNESQDDYAKGEESFLPALVKSQERLKLAIKWAVASDKSVVARAMYEDFTTDLRPKLKDIKTPVTMLYPYDSGMNQEQETVDAMYRDNFAALPNKKLVRIDNSMHFIMLDQPDEFAKQVDAFLK
ncbi:MAG TPA: alpha/beta hydrolase [Verrucomicrobiae bacterium]|jgi:pimeloyl-ACP methyl ester carboxylesterase